MRLTTQLVERHFDLDVGDCATTCVVDPNEVVPHLSVAQSESVHHPSGAEVVEEVISLVRRTGSYSGRSDAATAIVVDFVTPAIAAATKLGVGRKPSSEGMVLRDDGDTSPIVCPRGRLYGRVAPEPPSVPVPRQGRERGTSNRMEDAAISRGRFVRCLGGGSLVSVLGESGPVAWGGP